MFFPPQRVIKVSLTSERNTIITLHSSVTLFYFIQSHLKFVFLRVKEQVSLKGWGWRGFGDQVRVRVCLGRIPGVVDGEPRAWHEQRAGDVAVPWAPHRRCTPPLLTGHCWCAMAAPSLQALQQGGNRQQVLARAVAQGCPRAGQRCSAAAPCSQPSATVANR